MSVFKFCELKKSVFAGNDGVPESIHYKLSDSGIIINNVIVDSGNGGEETNILLLTDTHFAGINEMDEAEAYPCVIESVKKRGGFDVERTRANLDRIMRFSAEFDKVAVLGDFTDYLTHGAHEIYKNTVLDKRADTVTVIGNHDLTRCAGHRMADETSRESRKAIVSSVIPNDISYYKEPLGKRYLGIFMDNTERRYSNEQLKKLTADIEYARKNSIGVIIFQHEPLCTHMEADKKTKAIYVVSEWCYNAAYNFCDGKDKIGTDKDDEITAAVYSLITGSADVIRALFCGHWHNPAYTEILATYTDGEGNCHKCNIPQYVVGSAAYLDGFATALTLK